MAAVCELEISGVLCEVTAVGRCTGCGRAFCPSHQGWQGRRYTDSCQECLDRKKREREEATERSYPAQRRDWEAAEAEVQRLAALLRDAGSPGLCHRRELVRYRRTMFGNSKPVYRDVPSAWLIDSVSWEVNDTTYSTFTSSKVTKGVVTAVTEQGEVVPYFPKAQPYETLLGVQPWEYARIANELRAIAREHGLQP